MRIDLNCDLGESFGNYMLGMDAEVIPSIASVILEIDATSSSEVALKSDTRSLILEASML